jgi:glycolate oxidase iron-sulfur subunit
MMSTAPDPSTSKPDDPSKATPGRAREANMRFVDDSKLRSCVHCGLCLSSCPTYVELGNEADSPRGRIHLMRALEEGRLDPTSEVTAHLDACLGCRACETACPSGVPYGSLIEAARPFIEQSRPQATRRARRLLDRLLTHPVLREAAAAPLRLIAGRDPTARAARALASDWLAWAAALPPWRGARVLPRVLPAEGEERGTALLLLGCVARTSFPATAVSTARLLSRAGVRVLVPRETACCGALSLHLGQKERSQDLARELLELLKGRPADWVVPTAAGCGAHLQGLEHLLPDVSRAQRVAEITRDPLQLLDELGLPSAPERLDLRVAVHDACHLTHGQGVRDAPRRLLASIPGVELVELHESDFCCGSAGTYNLTERELAGRLRTRKISAIAASRADVIAAANPGCLLQIRSGAILRDLRVDIEHPIDLLARAHGVAD